MLVLLRLEEMRGEGRGEGERGGRRERGDEGEARGGKEERRKERCGSEAVHRSYTKNFSIR